MRKLATSTYVLLFCVPIYAITIEMKFHPKLILVLVALLGTIAYVSIRRFYVRRRFVRAHGCQPVVRSSNKDPFVGLHTIPGTIRALREHKILERSCELFRVHGTTFAVKQVQKSAILTIEPENIKTILSLKFKDYDISHGLEPFKPLLGKGIFDTDGDHWATSRALIRPSFSCDQVADLTSFEDLIQDLFLLLPRDGKTVVDLVLLLSRPQVRPSPLSPHSATADPTRGREYGLI